LRGHVTNPKQVTKTCQLKVFEGYKFPEKIPKMLRHLGIMDEHECIQIQGGHGMDDVFKINKLVGSIVATSEPTMMHFGRNFLR